MNIPDIRIETARLVLRPPVGADFDAYAANMADAAQKVVAAAKGKS